jgi:hypothetical protein
MVTQEKGKKPAVTIVHDDIIHSYDLNKFYSPVTSDNKNYAFYYADAFSDILDVAVVDVKGVSTANKFIVFVKLDMVHFEYCINNPQYNNDDDINNLVSFLRYITAHINNGKCMLFFDTCTWPTIPSLHKAGITRLYMLLKIAGITCFKNITLITSAHKNSENTYKCLFKVVFFEFFENALKIRNDKTINLHRKFQNFTAVGKRYRFLYLNHKEKVHRLYLFIKIFLSVDNFYNFFAASMSPGRPLFSKVKDRVGNFEAFKNGIIDFYDKQIPTWFYKSTQKEFVESFSELTDRPNGSIMTEIAPWATGDNWKSPKIQWTLDADLWEKIGIYIGVETNYAYSKKHAKDGDDYLSLTEKTFKPIMMKTPFILFGQPFILKKLKEYGYMTFNNCWDESYDEEISHVKRANKIADVITRLTKLSDREFADLLQRAKDIVEHNYNVFYKRAPENEICDTIIKFYEEENN